MIIKIMGPGCRLCRVSLSEPCFVLAEKCDLAAKIRFDSIRTFKFGFKEQASCENSRLC
jgi:hypothetical protein